MATSGEEPAFTSDSFYAAHFSDEDETPLALDPTPSPAPITPSAEDDAAEIARLIAKQDRRKTNKKHRQQTKILKRLDEIVGGLDNLDRVGDKGIQQRKMEVSLLDMVERKSKPLATAHASHSRRNGGDNRSPLEVRQQSLNTYGKGTATTANSESTTSNNGYSRNLTGHISNSHSKANITNATSRKGKKSGGKNDWICTSCNYENHSYRVDCNLCGIAKEVMQSSESIEKSVDPLEPKVAELHEFAEAVLDEYPMPSSAPAPSATTAVRVRSSKKPLPNTTYFGILALAESKLAATQESSPFPTNHFTGDPNATVIQDSHFPSLSATTAVPAKSTQPSKPPCQPSSWAKVTEDESIKRATALAALSATKPHCQPRHIAQTVMTSPAVILPHDEWSIKNLNPINAPNAKHVIKKVPKNNQAGGVPTRRDPGAPALPNNKAPPSFPEPHLMQHDAPPPPSSVDSSSDGSTTSTIRYSAPYSSSSRFNSAASSRHDSAPSSSALPNDHFSSVSQPERIGTPERVAHTSNDQSEIDDEFIESSPRRSHPLSAFALVNKRAIRVDPAMNYLVNEPLEKNPWIHENSAEEGADEDVLDFDALLLENKRAVGGAGVVEWGLEEQEEEVVEQEEGGDEVIVMSERMYSQEFAMWEDDADVSLKKQFNLKKKDVSAVTVVAEGGGGGDEELRNASLSPFSPDDVASFTCEDSGDEQVEVLVEEVQFLPGAPVDVRAAMPAHTLSAVDVEEDEWGHCAMPEQVTPVPEITRTYRSTFVAASTQPDKNLWKKGKKGTRG
ncbi:hypothetical protein HDU98_010847 [Podochytrium sp. JEL0797]|nr:hypothetical protein HDU98_010847 [Podochytrium sp. JEL0797]